MRVAFDEEHGYLLLMKKRGPRPRRCGRSGPADLRGCRARERRRSRATSRRSTDRSRCGCRSGPSRPHPDSAAARSSTRARISGPLATPRSDGRSEAGRRTRPRRIHGSPRRPRRGACGCGCTRSLRCRPGDGRPHVPTTRSVPAGRRAPLRWHPRALPRRRRGLRSMIDEGFSHLVIHGGDRALVTAATSGRTAHIR